MGNRTATATEILDTAQRLVQTRGFSGFSYADIAEVVGTTKAAIHYHFPSKHALGSALIARYAADFDDALRVIDAQDGTAMDKLTAYAALYHEVLEGGRLCLCGMLATEHETLPSSISSAVAGFFDDNLAWLERVLLEGAADGTVQFDGPASAGAELVLGALEGAMLVAWSRNELALFERGTQQLLRSLTVR